MNMSLNMYDGDRETLIGEMPKKRRCSDRRAESTLLLMQWLSIDRGPEQGPGEMNVYLNGKSSQDQVLRGSIQMMYD